ncbi:MAG TPA: DNA-binding protein [Anaerolineae bacterium]|nr:DNA-binding protein [Anaerolineae bacterium]HIQ06340.1 DNA-binding protein [Anaerolineae bacterium]
MESVPQWLTVAEAAEYLRVSDSTVRRYVREGLLPAARLPDKRGIRVRRSDLETLLSPDSPLSLPQSTSTPSQPEAED